MFFFDSTASNTGNSGVEVYVNGNLVYYFGETNGDSINPWHQHNFLFASKLEEDDEVLFYNGCSYTLYKYAIAPMTFVGYKAN